MTAQEVFENVAVHLLTQQQKSTTRVYRPFGRSFMCDAYRGDYGTKCAVGCLITDEAYSKDFEGKVFSTIQGAKGLEHLREHNELISKLQEIHDCTNVDDWGAELSWVASEAGLSFGIVAKQFGLSREEHLQ